MKLITEHLSTTQCGEKIFFFIFNFYPPSPLLSHGATILDLCLWTIKANKFNNFAVVFPCTSSSVIVCRAVMFLTFQRTTQIATTSAKMWIVLMIRKIFSTFMLNWNLCGALVKCVLVNQKVNLLWVWKIELWR